MSWSLNIGSVAGTAVRIHVTFLLLLAWIFGVNYISGGPQAAWNGLLFIVLLFLCVLLHEFGHIFAARGFGIRTPDVILLPIGGVSRLERIPEEPRRGISHRHRRTGRQRRHRFFAGVDWRRQFLRRTSVGT